MADDPNEWFDVVDEADQVVGRAPRGEVHARGLLHRAVHVIVQRADGDVFLQKRSMGKDTCPGRWDSSCSGHLDSGEDYLSAAVRELGEELGIAVAVKALVEIGCLAASEQTDWEFVRIYRVSHEGPFTLHPDEISAGCWYSPKTIDDWLQNLPDEFPPCFHSVWKIGREYLEVD